MSAYPFKSAWLYESDAIVIKRAYRHQHEYTRVSEASRARLLSILRCVAITVTLSQTDYSHPAKLKYTGYFAAPLLLPAMDPRLDSGLHYFLPERANHRMYSVEISLLWDAALSFGIRADMGEKWLMQARDWLHRKQEFEWQVEQEGRDSRYGEAA